MSEHWSESSSWEGQCSGGATDSEHWSESESSSRSGEGPSAEAAAEELVRFLLDLQIGGRMSARTLCVICWWASKAGCRSSELAKYAHEPEAQSGKFQRRIDSAMGISVNTASYSIRVPVYKKGGVTREEEETAVEIPYEQLLAEIADTPDFEDTLRNAVDQNRMPISYYSHEVVRAARAAGEAKPPVPVGLFIDGVAFLKKASFIALWAYCLTTGVRHVIAILRNDLLCTCGCRGWCSLYRIFAFAKWAFNAAAEATYPGARHDGAAWPDGDPRGDVAGSRMQHRFAVVWLKSDWGEIGHTLGFTTWSSKLWPCYCCNVEKDELHNVEESFAAQLPWALLTQQDYEDACAACEVDVVVPDRATHAKLRASLFFDRRAAGSRGRALSVDVQVGDIVLKAGDRLEASHLLDNTFAFDLIKQFPTRVRFWRPKSQSFSNRRNPLFSITGFTIDRLVVDLLHCLYLGVAQSWIVASLWALLRQDVWGTGSTILGIQRLRALLKVYYKRNAGLVTQIQYLSMKMLGTAKKPASAPFKGAEAKGLVNFVVSLLEQHSLVAPDLLLAGKQLQQYIKLIDTSPLNVAPPAQQAMREAVVGFLIHGLRGGMKPIAKVHQFLHAAHATRLHGNPRYYSNWIDESLNKDLAGVARAAYSSVWAARIFQCWRFLRNSRSTGLTL